VGSQPELLTCPNEPLRRVILVPFDGVSVIHGELMVEIVVALPNRRQRGYEMVARCVLVIKRGLSKPVRKRVDAECGLDNIFSSRHKKEREMRTWWTKHNLRTPAYMYPP
jgi:hypothetical protein